MGIPQRAWQWICLQPCRRAFIAPPVASFGMHIDSCTGDVRTRVHIPPQPINETAIQINVFSSGVAIMVEALGLKHGTAPAPSLRIGWVKLLCRCFSNYLARLHCDVLGMRQLCPRHGFSRSVPGNFPAGVANAKQHRIIRQNTQNGRYPPLRAAGRLRFARIGPPS